MKSCKSIREIVESNTIDEETWNLSNMKSETLEGIVGKRLLIKREDYIEDVCKAFEEDKVVVFNDEWHRGIGKTSIVAEISRYYNVPVIVGSSNQKKHYKNMGIEQVFTTEEIRGIPKGRTLIVDLFAKSKDIINDLRFRGFEPVGFIHQSRKLYEIL